MTFLASSENYLYRSGDIFLGLSSYGEIGITPERHAITVAGSRSGKGACCIIPNLLRWPHNTLVIDPKGENAKATYEARLKLGKSVYVLDPFQSVDVPDNLRAAFNPLDMIDPESISAAEDIEVIADGLVKRSDPKHAQWDDGAAAILAGVIAYTIMTAPPQYRTLKAARSILLQGRDELYADAQRMLQNAGCGGLSVEAGLSIMTAFDAEKSMEADFLGGARRHSKWLDRPAMENALGQSSFQLSELKNGNASVYLVLPPEYLQTHGAFLRLFVRCAILAMAKGGSGQGQKCLFILDEFFALGRIDEIAVSCGLMPSYGVHLWPFLQDLAQLKNLYGAGLWETFFSNSDASVFFGNVDLTTTKYISDKIGNISPEELNIEPPTPVDTIRTGYKSEDNILNHAYSEMMTDYSRKTKEIGRPRMPPEFVENIIGRRKNDSIANSMLVFTNSGQIIHLKTAPYFEETKFADPTEIATDIDKLKGHEKFDEVEKMKKLRLTKRRITSLLVGNGLPHDYHKSATKEGFQEVDRLFIEYPDLRYEFADDYIQAMYYYKRRGWRKYIYIY